MSTGHLHVNGFKLPPGPKIKDTLSDVLYFWKHMIIMLRIQMSFTMVSFILKPYAEK